MLTRMDVRHERIKLCLFGVDVGINVALFKIVRQRGAGRHPIQC